MADFEIYTIANGLGVGLRSRERVNGRLGDVYCFVINVAYTGTVDGYSGRSRKVRKPRKEYNRLYEAQDNWNNTGIRSNTDSKVFPSTWHLSIDAKGKPLDPWTVWKQTGFEISKVEIITGKEGAQPWLSSLRRRDATVIREEQAAVANYNKRVETAKRLMQQSAPKPLPAPIVKRQAVTVRRSSSRNSSDSEKRRISEAVSLDSRSSTSNTGKTGKLFTTLEEVNSVASTATGQIAGRYHKKQGWGRGFWKRSEKSQL